MVSSSTPNATAKPSSVKNVTGSVPRTANVPASTAPADVITPPVTDKPVSAPQQHEDDEHHGEDDRDDEVPVVCRRPLHVQVHRGVAADDRVRAGNGVHDGAGAVDGVVGGLAVGSRGEGGLNVAVPGDLGRL